MTHKECNHIYFEEQCCFLTVLRASSFLQVFPAALSRSGSPLQLGHAGCRSSPCSPGTADPCTALAPVGAAGPHDEVRPLGAPQSPLGRDRGTRWVAVGSQLKGSGHSPPCVPPPCESSRCFLPLHPLHLVAKAASLKSVLRHSRVF